MADVRALLKSERATRQISHPHATYSTTGTLVCLVCHIQLKSESLWSGHLRSPQHAMRLQRMRTEAGAAAPDTAAQNGTRDEQSAVAAAAGEDLGSFKHRKRKADSDGEEEGLRKRNKADEGKPRDAVCVSHSFCLYIGY